MLGISDMHKDLINSCDCTPGLYKHCNRVCSKVDTKKNPLLHMGVEPVSAACWTWCPTKLHPHPICFYLHHLSLDLRWLSSVIRTILFTCVNSVVIRSLISAVSHTFLFIIFTLKTTQNQVLDGLVRVLCHLCTWVLQSAFIHWFNHHLSIQARTASLTMQSWPTHCGCTHLTCTLTDKMLHGIVFSPPQSYSLDRNKTKTHPGTSLLCLRAEEEVVWHGRHWLEPVVRNGLELLLHQLVKPCRVLASCVGPQRWQHRHHAPRKL